MAAEIFNQISPSEFFYRNRDLAGFSNPTRSLYTAVREFVENSLDACDQRGILPNVRLVIRAEDPEARDPRTYILTVHDNGPGVAVEHVPLAFGTVLYGSKFGLKQARGMFGLGATMAILYGQITTNKPVHVSSSTDGKTKDTFEILLDIQKNKPVILKHATSKARQRGLSVSITLEGDYSKAGSKIRDYVYQTSLITPYATISFEDPKGETFRYDRILKSMPPPPTVINPHPHGVDVETIRRMILESRRDLVSTGNAAADRLIRALGLKNGDAGYDVVARRVAQRWKRLSPAARLPAALATALKCSPRDLPEMTIHDIDVADDTITYHDGIAGAAKTAQLDRGQPYYSYLEEVAAGEPLQSFLTARFQRVGPRTAERFTKFAAFKPERRIGTLDNRELVRLSDSLQAYGEFLAPDPSCLAPLGQEPLRRGMAKFFEPDFLSVVMRSASAYSGFPFVVEMGIAYGGGIQTRGIKAYRFANRIPLLYDEGSDVVLKVINDMDWNRYKVKGEAPLVIATHICSTRIPYKTVGKENVADRPEIERELRLGLQFLARKLSSYMSRRGKAEAAKKRANLYAKYIPLVSQFCTELAGRKAEPKYAAMLKLENSDG